MSQNSRAIYWQRQPFYLNGTVASNEATGGVVWEGDSMAFATFGCSYLYSRLPVINLAVPGSTTADMVARAGNPTGIDNQLAPNRLAIIWGGPYNGLAGQPDTVAAGDAAADAFFAYMDGRIAAGWGSGGTRIAIMNMARRGNNPAGYPQIAWAQCAARITAEAALHSNFPALEPSVMPGTPGDRRLYDVDSVHFYPVGYQWVSRNIVAPFIYGVRF